MAMAAWSFRFDQPPSEADLRARLRAEIGRRASERNVELEWGDDGRLVILSQDGVALVYAAKVCLALGGVPTELGSDEPRPLVLPEWTGTPWVALPWWTRFRLLLGPTPLVGR